MRLVNSSKSAQTGFTLVELLVVLAVTVILALQALPAMSNYILNSKLRESANALVTMATFTRNEAIKRNTSLTLRTTDGKTVDVIEAGDSSPLRSVQLSAPAQTAAFSRTFSSAGRLTPFGTELRAQVSGGTLSACGEDIRCPGVLIEAGGAVSLCREGACP